VSLREVSRHGKAQHTRLPLSPFFCKYWFKTNITRVQDLLDNNGYVLSFDQFSKQFQLNPFNLYFGSIKSIPTPSSLSNTLVQYFRTDTTRKWLNTTRTGGETMVYESYRSWSNGDLHIISKTGLLPRQYDPFDLYESYES